MSTDRTEVNPYASPQAELHASPDAAGPSEPKRFRWRMIPAAFLMIFGETTVGMSIALAALLVYELVTQWFSLVPDDFLSHVSSPEIVVTFGSGGGLWIYSAFEWQRGRWWRAILTTILGFALITSGLYLLL